MQISIIIPAYNEEKTISEVLSSIQKSFKDTTYEIIIVDDGSKDKTGKICEDFINQYQNIKYFKLSRNYGKGYALRFGFKEASGMYIAIQDADLEYDPFILRKLCEDLKENVVVYGKRDKKQGYYMNILGNRILSAFCNILYNSNLSDIYTCYKIIPNKILQNLNLVSNGFEIEAEITAKLLKNKITIIEKPITYNPRTFNEGKHIRAKDGIIGIWSLVKFRN